MTLWTVGHGTAQESELADLLRSAGVRQVVDIRVAPGSRRHPQFNKDALAMWLPAAGVQYRWERRLGGFRRPSVGSPDIALRNDSFRGYAAWMRTPDFADALDAVLQEALAEPTTVMCSESVWWRCHRRLVADAVVLRHGVDVLHLMHDGRQTKHQPTAGVRVAEDGLLIYDAGQPTL